MHTVIVGGGFAGIKAALELSKRQAGSVTLISDRPYFLHHATLYATASGSDPHESVISLEDIFAQHPDVKIVIDSLKSLDPERNLVVTKKANFTYDTLIMALGSVATYFDVPGAEQRSFGISTLEGIQAFHAHLHAALTSNRHLDKQYVIVGGGYTGVELAGSLGPYIRRLEEAQVTSRAKVHITLVEAADRLLPAASRSASRRVQDKLEKLGVSVLTDRKVVSLDKEFITLDDKKIPTQTVIWTAGSANNPFFAQHSQFFELSDHGRVVVNPYLEAYRNIYVIGDNLALKGSGRVQPALDSAKFIARHIVRKSTGAPLRQYRPRTPMLAVPVGEDWAYVERWGMYLDGRLGKWLRDKAVLSGYEQLMSKTMAKSAAAAHRRQNNDTYGLHKP